MVAELKGHALAGLRWGESETSSTPVLCLHGWLDNAASFQEIVPSLRAASVVAVDLPGHGKSPWRPAGQGYPVWGYTQALKDYVSQCAEPVDIVAHSLGGSLALCLAAAFPEYVRSLVLLDSPGPLITPENQVAKQLRDGVESRTALRPSRRFDSLACAIKARRKATPDLSNAAIEALVDRNLARVEGGFEWRTDPQLKLVSELRLCESQVEHLMKAVACPVLSVRAERGLIPEKFFEHRMGYLQTAEAKQLPGHHHFHMECETAPAIADAINQFWERL